MVSLTRSSGDGAAVASRDSTVATIWRDLNRVGLRVGTATGLAAAAGYAVLFALTLDHGFILSGTMSLLVGLIGLSAIRRPAGDVEWMLIAAALAMLATSFTTSATMRGTLWAAIVVFAMLGTLVLPDHKQLRFNAAIAALLVGQLLGPVFGQATLVDSASSFVVSVASAGAGVVMIMVAKRALAKSERTRIEIFRSVPVGLFRCGPNGDLIDSNPALAGMLGYAGTADVIGRNVADLHESSDDWWSLTERLDEGHGPLRFAHRMKRGDGEVIWVRGFAQTVRTVTGQLLFHEGSIEDITQRRETEARSRQNAERFRNVFERAPIGIWEEDYSRVGDRLEQLRSDGVDDLAEYLGEHPEEIRRLTGLIEFLDVNPAGIELIRAPSKEQALINVLPDTAPAAVVEGFVAEFLAIWEDRDSIMLEITGTTADGESTDLALSWAAARRSDGTLDLSRVVVAIQDIAIIKDAERQLEALIQSKDELIATVSHELRTPLTSILGIALELRDNHSSLSRQEVAELVSLIADQSGELANIVEDLLVAAHTEAGTISIKPQRVDIANEIDKILPTDPSHAELTIDEDVFARADPLRVRQILRNLLTNAQRYGGETITVEAHAVADRAIVRVEDTGSGIPESEQESIFEPYVRSGGDGGLPGSLGLGLSVSRQLARLMGGDLTYEYDGGSVFELSLPRTAR